MSDGSERMVCAHCGVSLRERVFWVEEPVGSEELIPCCEACAVAAWKAADVAELGE